MRGCSKQQDRKRLRCFQETTGSGEVRRVGEHLPPMEGVVCHTITSTSYTDTALSTWSKQRGREAWGERTMARTEAVAGGMERRGCV